MEPIDAALRSLEDSLSRLGDRFRGTESEVLQLFRARIGVDESQARLSSARANGAIKPGWGKEYVDPINRAAMLVAVSAAVGDPSFRGAMKATGEALGSVADALP